MSLAACHAAVIAGLQAVVMHATEQDMMQECVPRHSKDVQPGRRDLVISKAPDRGFAHAVQSSH